VAPSNHQKKPNSTWKQENPQYGIYNLDKHITISTRLPRLQNILRVEFTTIYYKVNLYLTNYGPKKFINRFEDLGLSTDSRQCIAMQ